MASSKWDNHFGQALIMLPQQKVCKSKSVACMPGKSLFECWYLRFAVMLFWNPRAYVQTMEGTLQLAFVHPILRTEASNGYACKAGAIFEATTVGSSRYGITILHTHRKQFPDKVYAGGIRPGEINTPRCLMPPGFVVEVTGHSLKGK